MFNKVSERQMHRLRWLITLSWLILICSLFYDPITPWLSASHNFLSPLRIVREVCIQVQGVCLEEKPYALGAPIFWGIVIPFAIFSLLVVGHEFWRRICPLSFLSQIPRALGIQRQHKLVNPKTGQTRYEIPKVQKNTWLGRNYLYLQFTLLYLGLCCRILFVNSNRLLLPIFLIGIILTAIAIGFFYRGKTWCNYFCPMSVVQKIYGQPRGLLTSKAHEAERRTITQSTCRTVSQEGKEKSACVGCQTVCIDLDAEKSYWDGITRPEIQFIYYAYFGLVIGYFIYYYLYAGNWDYYLSGAWAHEEEQLSNLFKPGFYLFNQPIPIPKLVAVPLTLAVFTWGSYFLGRRLEKTYKGYLKRNNQPINQVQIRHRMFTCCTFIVFNFFFIFAGRNFIYLLPWSLQYIFDASIILLSTIWLYRTWKLSSERYTKESLANLLRSQLSQLDLNLSQLLPGSSLSQLNADEVYVLAKVLAGFSKNKRLEIYKGVLKQALTKGYIQSFHSLLLLQQVRLELDLTDEEHQQVLQELVVSISIPTEKFWLFYSFDEWIQKNYEEDALLFKYE
ncbi:MAG: 4Fe-4S binding protein [Prochloraceae cyanobacterium]